MKSPLVGEPICSKDEGSTRRAPRLPSFIFSFNISKASLGSSFIWKINLNLATILPLLKTKRFMRHVGKIIWKITPVIHHIKRLFVPKNLSSSGPKDNWQKLFKVTRRNWLKYASSTRLRIAILSKFSLGLNEIRFRTTQSGINFLIHKYTLNLIPFNFKGEKLRWKDVLFFWHHRKHCHGNVVISPKWKNENLS